MSGLYAGGLTQNAANYTPLTPLSFIERTAQVYPGRCAVIHGARRYTWQDTYERSRRLASALIGRGIQAGDTVAVMLSNTPEMIECHFGVAMSGAVLNTLNTRLDAESIALMLGHGEARALIADREYSAVIEPALARLGREILLIEVDDSEYAGPGKRQDGIEYEDFLAGGDPDFAADEWNAIALDYTSGTTGNPKGVVYHHRGAYLNAVSNIVSWGMPPAAAPPPASVIEGMEKIGFTITHVYGLTETYGPAAVCAKQDEWASLPIDRRTERNGRQGVRYHLQEGVTVMDPQTMQPLPKTSTGKIQKFVLRERAKSAATIE
ncbi:long-chain-fatty-acid--CoA ligase [mine drainage metagenome]|uniref:Long-chain-fatty-acid--CoA ligase n=1 Tax=mine drainage metagenome TaxID=410659 RepID=A0A1J5RT89_9ZZZZ